MRIINTSKKITSFWRLWVWRSIQQWRCRTKRLHILGVYRVWDRAVKSCRRCICRGTDFLRIKMRRDWKESSCRWVWGFRSRSECWLGLEWCWRRGGTCRDRSRYSCWIFIGRIVWVLCAGSLWIIFFVKFLWTTAASHCASWVTIVQDTSHRGQLSSDFDVSVDLSKWFFSELDTQCACREALWQWSVGGWVYRWLRRT